MIKRTAALTALLVLSIGTAAACSSEKTVTNPESEAVEFLESEGLTDPEVSCDGDLKAEEGEEIACEWSDADGNEGTAVISVTSVDGDDVRLGITAESNE